jgi:uncharacterized protein (DUF2267 family)
MATQRGGSPGAPDPIADLNYRPLLEALAREVGHRAEATRAVEAVMCALAQRVAGDEFEDLRELLPEPFRGRLAACERHAARPAGPFRTAEDFYAVVGEDLGAAPAEVETKVRAVFAAIRDQLPEAAAEDVAGQLPPELDVLWRRLS